MQRKSKDEPVKHNKKVQFSGMEEEQKVFFYCGIVYSKY